jgi:hypothetical protein
VQSAHSVDELVRLAQAEETRAKSWRSCTLSTKAVDTYRSQLMAKVGAANVPELVLHALRSGLIDATGA